MKLNRHKISYPINPWINFRRYYILTGDFRLPWHTARYHRKHCRRKGYFGFDAYGWRKVYHVSGSCTCTGGCVHRHHTSDSLDERPGTAPQGARHTGCRHPCRQIEKRGDTDSRNCIFGGIKILYVSPERLASEIFQTKLRHIPVSFITVDEAHCISQWGYDFRPSYLNIASIRDMKPNTPILALTATATPDVVNDIQENCISRRRMCSK